MEPKCTSAKLLGRGARQEEAEEAGEAGEAEEAGDPPTRTRVKKCRVSFEPPLISCIGFQAPCPMP